MKEFIINVKKIWQFSKKEKTRIVIYFLLGIINVANSIILPFISARIVVGLTSNNLKQFIFMGLVFLICTLISDTIGTIRNKINQKVFRNVYINLQTSLGSEILKLSNKSLEKNGSGVFIQRLVGDTKTISSVFPELIGYINGVIANIGVLVTYFVLSKIMFIFVLIAFAIRLVIEVYRINTYNESDKEFKKDNDSMTGFTGELVRGASDIKMLNGEKSFLKELKIRFESLNNKKYEMERKNSSILIIRWYWAEISFFLMICILAYQLNKGMITIPVAVVLYGFGNRYNGLVSNITGFHELIKRFNVSANRIFDIFDDNIYEKESFGKKHLNDIEGNFEFKNVAFKYDKNRVLNGVSFKVNRNETVAFVGKSGAGKTTIFNLLCKMYDNYKGKITIDGNDLKELDKDSIRGNITIVGQNPYIFNMSIKDNLRLVKDNLTNKEMKEACKLACLDEFIEGLPQKYDTVVGEGGVTLSGGQKQRLAIARAFVQKTQIILFDEATSALDNKTQREIQKAIDNMKQDYTILIIAHRLSTIINADRILFLNNGKIEAEGTHKELLKTCKEYKELYDSEIKNRK